MSSLPHVTVAAVIERNGKFLLVEEHTDDGMRLNQPAGHLESEETLQQAVVRETREETGYGFRPERLVGIYHWHHQAKGVTFVRFAFAGEASGQPNDGPLDTEIIRALWLSADEIRAARARHRSPLVLACLEDYLLGRSYGLDLITSEF